MGDRNSFLREVAIATLLGTGLLVASSVGATAATVSGTITIDATIAVGANVPAKTVITAYGSVSESGSVASHGMSKTVTVAFTPGKTAHATLAMPYTWTVTRGATVYVYLSLSTNGSGLPFGLVSRPVPLPKNGATTTVALTAAI